MEKPKPSREMDGRVHLILNCDMAPAAQKILDAIRAIQCIDWTPAVRALRKASPRKWQ